MKKHDMQTGSAHAAIIIVLVVGIMGALGWVFWQNFMAQDANNSANSNNKTADDTTKKVTYSQYVNEKLGFKFEYPKQSYQPSECKKRGEGDYIVGKQSLVDMQVLENGNSYIVAPTAYPVVEFKEVGETTLGVSCEVKAVTLAMVLDKQSSVEARSWYVEEIDAAEVTAALVRTGDFEGYEFTASLEAEKDGRQKVVMNTSKAPAYGTFKWDAFYYPTEKLFAYFATGQAGAFYTSPDGSNPQNQHVLESFEVL